MHIKKSSNGDYPSLPRYWIESCIVLVKFVPPKREHYMWVARNEERPAEVILVVGFSRSAHTIQWCDWGGHYIAVAFGVGQYQ